MSYKSTPVDKLVPLHYRIKPYIKGHPKATAAVVILILVLALIDIGYGVRWTGFDGRTLWD